LASALFGLTSKVVGKLTQPAGPLYNIGLSFRGLVSFESASPIFSQDGQLIGSIGVSGNGAGRGTANDGNIAEQVAAYISASSDLLDYLQLVTLLPFL
jgi:uncharacterized protein GlcG (DUF336 family)